MLFKIRYIVIEDSAITDFLTHFLKNVNKASKIICHVHARAKKLLSIQTMSEENVHKGERKIKSIA